MSKNKYDSFETCLNANKNRKNAVEYCASAVGMGTKSSKKNSAVKMALMIAGGK